MDQFSYESHQKALAAIQPGKFEDEIVPVTVTNTALDEKGKAKTVEVDFQDRMKVRVPILRSKPWRS